MAKVVVITGTPNDQSRLNGVLQYVTDILEEENLTVESIKVHSLPPEDLITARFNSEAILNANNFVEGAKGVVILTPVYKASFSGILKTYLDLLPQKVFEKKVLLPLVVGGSFGHLLTIEYALNPILSALGATYILNGVYTVDKQIERADDNKFFIHEEAKIRLKKGIDSLTTILKS